VKIRFGIIYIYILLFIYYFTDVKKVHVLKSIFQKCLTDSWKNSLRLKKCFAGVKKKFHVVKKFTWLEKMVHTSKNCFVDV
jgi:hypothetical protein